MLHLQSWLASLLLNGASKTTLPNDACQNLLGEFSAKDSVQVMGDPQSDGSQCLHRLAWQPSEFGVSVGQNIEIDGRLIVTFPSPVDGDSGCSYQAIAEPKGVGHQDSVYCDWFPAPSTLMSTTRDGGEPPEIPAVIVVHELGERMHVGRTIARGIQRRGLHAFLVNLPTYGHRRLQPGNAYLLTSLFEQAITDVRRAADAIACLPTVDESRIVLQGTSLGGFIASVSASFDDRFHGVFLCLAGSDLLGILREGNADARETRNRLAAAGLEGQRLADALWNIEPSRIASRLRSDQTWLYSGRFDRVVPLAYARKLARDAKLGTNHKVFPVGHYTGFVCLPRLFADIGNAVSRNKREIA